MKLEDDLMSLQTGFIKISAEYRSILVEKCKLSEELSRKENTIEELKSETQRQKEDLSYKQTMLEMLNNQLTIIPEFKIEVDELNKRIKGAQTTSDHNKDEVHRLNKKHLDDLTKLKDEIEGERQESKSSENRCIEEVEEFFKQAQEATLGSFNKQAIAEKKLLQDQIVNMEKEMATQNSEHEEKISRMKVQLESAKRVASQNKPNSSEIYRKKMQAMQEHYENQIQDLLVKLAPGNNKDVPSSTDVGGREPVKKRKKVNFNLSENREILISPKPVKTDPPSTPEALKNKNQNEDVGMFESLFAYAANRFNRKVPNQIDHEAISDIGVATVSSTFSSIDPPSIKLPNQKSLKSSMSQKQGKFKFSSRPSSNSFGLTEFLNFTPTSVNNGGGSEDTVEKSGHVEVYGRKNESIRSPQMESYICGGAKNGHMIGEGQDEVNGRKNESIRSPQMESDTGGGVKHGQMMDSNKRKLFSESVGPQFFN